MSFFKKILGNTASEKKPTNIDSGFEVVEKEAAHTFEELLAQHAALAMEKQGLFGEVIGDNSWQLDMNKGVIYFGDIVFPIQIIGSISFESNSWMWGWANTKSGMPDNLLVQANELKAMGTKNGIKELTDGHFDVEEGFEHQMGMIACGVFKSNSYYCANYGQGTLVVTIASDAIPSIAMDRAEKVLTVFPQLISAISIDHKDAFKNYLIDRDFKLKITATEIEGLRDGKKVVAKFDNQDRLASLNGTI